MQQHLIGVPWARSSPQGEGEHVLLASMDSLTLVPRVLSEEQRAAALCGASEGVHTAPRQQLGHRWFGGVHFGGTACRGHPWRRDAHEQSVLRVHVRTKAREVLVRLEEVAGSVAQMGDVITHQRELLTAVR